MSIVRISLATDAERERIYGMRHEVYAAELGQHPTNAGRRLQDPLDKYNHYLVGRVDGELAGFVSITPPGRGAYSIDKYVARERLPVTFDDGLFEARILTVAQRFRGSAVAPALGHAAIRWAEAHGGTQLMIIGRREVLTLYERAGLARTGISFQAGAVEYEVMTATLADVRHRWRDDPLWQRLARRIDWQLAIPFDPQPGAFHGGSSMAEIGIGADAPRRSAELIAADVLDAWFPPSPAVMHVLGAAPEWLARASPPTDASALRAAIAAVRGVLPSAIAVGSGLSDLIFRALPRWLTASDRVTLIEPQYGEYRHVLQTVVGCQIARREIDWRDRASSLDAIGLAVSSDADLVVIVNPNNPTGLALSRVELEPILRNASVRTRVWIDETYLDFVDGAESLEQMAAASKNIVIGKSMSKVYALSGLRAGYLCGPPALIRELASFTPPWAVSRPAQMAAVAALGDPEYYRARYEDTRTLREGLAAGIRALPGIATVEGCANFIFCTLAPDSIDAPTLIERARDAGLFIRGFPHDPRLRWGAIRIAVEDAATNARMIEVLGRCLSASASRVPQLAEHSATIAAVST